LAREFWDETAKYFPIWEQVQLGRLPASEVRDGYIHGHGIALQSLGKAGNALLKSSSKGDWRSRLPKLAKIDWSRGNSALWEGRAMIGGKISKVTTNITLTTNVIKQALGLALNEEEAQVEAAYGKGKPKRFK
jgi:DNA sulfur modification protein DndB